MTSLLERVEDSPGQFTNEAPVTPRHQRWIAMALAFLAVGVVLGIMMGNDEVQAGRQFDRADQSLRSTDGRLAVAKVQLVAIRHDLAFVGVQIGASNAALSSDATLLQAIHGALVEAQEDVSTKSAYITNLKACQSGIEQSLNALSVGDRSDALNALNAVTVPCQSVASNG
jgi:hypothetical protein